MYGAAGRLARVRRLVAGICAALFCLAASSPGVNYYLDVNDSAPGFGTTSGTYTISGAYWTTNPAGDTATEAFSQGVSRGDQFTIGNTATDFPACNITINLDAGNPPNFTGLAINSTNVTVTMLGGGNFYQGGAGTWFVAKGSVLNEAASMGGVALNWNGVPVTLSGGGVINFKTAIGFNNASGRITEDDAGAGLTVNLHTSRTMSAIFGGGFTLISGNLNFATAAASNALGSGTIVLAGGTIDNTSGSAMTLCDMNGYVISNSFVFAGSSSLSLGTAAVTLVASPVVTVNSNTLTISGTIDGAYSLSKAGAGKLVLEGTNGYSGLTTVSNGTLAVYGSLQGGVMVESGAALDGTGVVNGAVSVLAGGSLNPGGTNLTGVLAVNSNVTLNGNLKVDIDGSGQCDLIQAAGALDISSCNLYINSPADVGKGDCIIATYTSLSGKFASVHNLPGGRMVYYNYKGENKIAVVVPRGLVITIK